MRLNGKSKSGVYIYANETRTEPRENRKHLSVQLSCRHCLPKPLHTSAAKSAVKPTGKVNISSHIYTLSKQD